MQLVGRINSMEAQERMLRDLDLPRLLCRMDTRMEEAEAIHFLQKYLCSEKEEILERSLLLGEFFEKSSREELDQLAEDLASLEEERRKYNQSADRIHLLLYSARRAVIYTRCMETIRSFGDRGFTSSRMQSLVEEIRRILETEAYRRCAAALQEHQKIITFPRRMGIAINTREDARPAEMGVLWASGEEANWNPLIGADDTSRQPNTLFPAMSYQREQYGTHFEEYLSRNLEKQWKAKIGKALDLWKKIELPNEQEVGALAEEFAFYAVGIRVMQAFAQRGYALCRPQIVFEPLMKTERMVYPELALSTEKVQGNGVRLENGGAVIVTGANHSGKTSYLKTVGQILLLAQLGFYVPATDLVFRPVHRIHTLFSAGEDSDMTASRMGIEVRILAEILDQAKAEDLVLINEPLTSTNPVEAISICADLIQKLLRNRVSCLVVTHLYDVYFLLRSTMPKEFQSQLKSLVTLARYEEHQGMIYSYQLIESEPQGTSYAMQTAESFGITLKDLIHNAADITKAQEFCEEEGKRPMYTGEEV